MNDDKSTSTNGKKGNILIREMTIDDLPRVFHLGETLFTSAKVPTLYRSWDEYEVVGLFYDDADFCFIAEQGKDLVGFVLGTTIVKKRSAWKYGYLVWMGVYPGIQRQGVGEKLFDSFLQAMLKEGVRMLLVDTEADNLSAIKFFKRLGFGNPEDHVYLNLNLSDLQRNYKLK